jgi:penicillin-binding protein 1C
MRLPALRHCIPGRWRIPLRLAALAVLLWAVAWFALPFAVPLPASLLAPEKLSPVLLDRHGSPIHHLTLPDFTRSEPVGLSELPPDFIPCTLAAEDKRFYAHGGIDVLAALRSLRDACLHRHILSGASTITQQLVKISEPPAAGRGLMVKLHECLVARRLEMTWTKEHILAAYINRLDYGNRRNGPSEAARYYFQKPLSDLSLADCALLAGIPRAPTRLDPMRHPGRSLGRRNVILQRLADAGSLDPARIASARAETPTFRPLQDPSHAPWLAGLRFDLPDPPSHITTTIDLPLQSSVETIVRDEIARLKNQNLRHAAVVMIDNPTGEILALVSSADWNDPRGGRMNGTLIPRSPGSALKPFTWLLAFEKGGLFPGSVVSDIPSRFRTKEGFDAPENYDRTFRGPVTARDALACSLNVPAMRQLNALGGPAPLHALLKQLGLTTLGDSAEPYGLGLTIGNAPVRLLELTNAYATIARGGVYLPVSFLTPGPGSHHTSPPPAAPLFSARSAFLIADILSDPAARAPSFGRHGPLELPFPCAAKTGTSSDYHDNWCLGFTREFTVGVWAGNFDYSPMKGLSGVAGAGPIFHRIMLRLHENRAPAWFDPPESVLRISIDPRTGKRLNDGVCANPAYQRSEWCQSAQMPLPAATTDYDPQGRALLDSSYAEWFHSPHNRRLDSLAMADNLPSDSPLRVLAPRPGATYFLDPELPSGGKRLRLASNLPDNVIWHSDTLVIEPSFPEPVAILTPGDHTLTAGDRRGGRAVSITIHVKAL